MTLLTTPQAVRNRIGFTLSSLTDAVIDEFITDAQATVEAKGGQVYSPGATKYNLAVSACKTLAAMLSLVHSIGGKTVGLDYSIDEVDIKKKEKMKGRLELIAELKLEAEANMNLLLFEPVVIPSVSTYDCSSDF